MPEGHGGQLKSNPRGHCRHNAVASLHQDAAKFQCLSLRQDGSSCEKRRVSLKNHNFRLFLQQLTAPPNKYSFSQ